MLNLTYQISHNSLQPDPAQSNTDDQECLTTEFYQRSGLHRVGALSLNISPGFSSDQSSKMSITVGRLTLDALAIWEQE
jgi:hypothetical protein